MISYVISKHSSKYFRNQSPKSRWKKNISPVRWLFWGKISSDGLPSKGMIRRMGPMPLQESSIIINTWKNRWKSNENHEDSYSSMGFLVGEWSQSKSRFFEKNTNQLTMSQYCWLKPPIPRTIFLSPYTQAGDFLSHIQKRPSFEMETTSIWWKNCLFD